MEHKSRDSRVAHGNFLKLVIISCADDLAASFDAAISQVQRQNVLLCMT